MCGLFVEEEDSTVLVLAERLVISPIRLILCKALITLVWGVSLSSVTSLNIYVNDNTHLHFILHIFGYVYLIHRWIVVFISG